MKYLRNLFAVVCTLVCGLLVMTNSAMAQATANPTQLLDTIVLSGKDFAIGLSDEGPGNFDPLVNDVARDFVDCTANNATGMTCIDQDTIVHWDPPVAGVSPETLFECGNNDLPFITRKGNGCTAIARDATGAIYLGGSLNGTANILIKVVEKPSGGCGAFNDFTDAGGNFCWATVESGRPRIEDIDVLEGSLLKGFTGDERQLLVLEEKKTVLIYRNFEDNPQDTIVDEIGSGKRDFDLSGKEQILNAMLMNYVRPDDADDRPGQSDFFVVVATDLGRLVTVDTDVDPSVVDSFDLIQHRMENNCSSEADSFDVAQGPAAGAVYASDRNDCSLHVLETSSDASGDFDGFTVDGSLSTSTDAAEAMLFAPLTISVSPGIGFDLDDCFPSCTLISSEEMYQPASLAEVMVLTEESGVVLFHITGLAGCPWIPKTCVDLLNGPDFTGNRDGAVAWLLDPSNFPGSPVGALLRLDADSTEYAPPAEELVLNVTPFLPGEVTDQIELSQPGGTPPLLYGPEYRAQLDNDFFFDALFFVPEPGVATDGVLTLDADVFQLVGSELGCELASELPVNFDLARLLRWDVMARVSERFPTFDAAYSDPGENFQGTSVNASCINPTRGRSGGISMFAINFEPTPCPVTFDIYGDLRSDCISDDDGPDDAVFAKLYVKLYDELLAHLLDRACEEIVSGNDDAPLLQADCATLEDRWHIGKDKLSKALLAIINNSDSAPKQNFQAFREAFDNYRTTLQNADTSGQPLDYANRVGEQEARLETLDHVYFDKMIPSIEAANDNLVEADSTWAEYP